MINVEENNEINNMFVLWINDYPSIWYIYSYDQLLFMV